jgi:hypothetical protein
LLAVDNGVSACDHLYSNGGIAPECLTLQPGPRTSCPSAIFSVNSPEHSQWPAPARYQESDR